MMEAENQSSASDSYKANGIICTDTISLQHNQCLLPAGNHV